MRNYILDNLSHNYRVVLTDTFLLFAKDERIYGTMVLGQVQGVNAMQS